MFRRILAITFSTICAGAALAACGGGHGRVVPDPPGSPSPSPSTTIDPPPTGTALVSVFVPKGSNAGGLSVKVYAHGDRNILLASSSIPLKNCSVSSGGQTCEAGLTPPAGTDDFVLTAYDKAPAQDGTFAGATVVGTAATQANVPAAGASVTVPAALGGAIARIALSVDPAAIDAVNASQVQLFVDAQDAQNRSIITSKYTDASGNASPIGVNVFPAKGFGSGSWSISAPAVNGFTVNYDGTALGGNQENFTATAGNVLANAVMSINAPVFNTVAGNYQVSPNPYSVQAGPNGTVWFTDRGGSTGAFGEINAASRSVIQEWPTANKPFAVVYNPSDHHFWWTEQDHAFIDEFDPANPGAGATRYPLNAADQPSATSITVAPDGQLWVGVGVQAGGGTQTIVVFNNITHVVSRTIALQGGFDPWASAFDGSGNFWVAERNAGQVQEITTSNQVVTYLLTRIGSPTQSMPFSIVQGPDGNMWVADLGQGVAGAIWKIPSAGGLPVPYALCAASAQCGATSIIVGADKNLWFSDFIGNAVGRITTSGVISEWRVPPMGSIQYPVPNRLTLGPDNNIWYSDSRMNRVTQFIPAP